MLTFPSSELPTVRPDTFNIGTDSYGDKPFMGKIDEFKIIHKREGEPGGESFQPYELYYGRTLNESDTTHMLLTNVRKTIADAERHQMTGHAFGLIENGNPDIMTGEEMWGEVVFMNPFEEGIDPADVQPVPLRLTQGANDFNTQIPVDSTDGFPEEGYILVEGSYTSNRTDPFTGRTEGRRGHYHVVFYYNGVSGDAFQGIERFMIIDDTERDADSIYLAQEEYAIYAPEGGLWEHTLRAALVSTTVEFSKRGALWSQRVEDLVPSGEGLFPEGWPIMCLRYPYGVLLEEPLDPESREIVFNSFHLDERVEKMHFELGDYRDEEVEVIGVDRREDTLDETTFDCDFHGCFGTEPRFTQNREVATLIPVRFFDRSARLSDSRHLQYLTLQTMKPGMHINAVGWREDDPHSPPLSRLRILMRVDNSCQWDTEPGSDDYSLREWISPYEDRFPIDSSGDEMSYDYFPGNFVEFRIFFEWEDGAYRTNDWKGCRILQNFWMYYERPTQILSSRKSVY
ncbi:MAG: hypothetical protein U5N86_00765 [Planctomycetota bacterium]|nr:hypothetical protein [Planctomycetota bacterium]